MNAKIAAAAAANNWTIEQGVAGFGDVSQNRFRFVKDGATGMSVLLHPKTGAIQDIFVHWGKGDNERLSGRGRIAEAVAYLSI